MSVDYTRNPDGEAPKDSEDSMFAPTPMWERGKRNRAKTRAERRSFFDRDDTVDEAPAAVGAGAAGAMASESMTARDSVRDTTTTTPTGEDAAFVTPTRTVVRRNRSVAPAAIGVGLVALAALAAIGWYATRPSDTTMTLGGAPTTAIAAAPPATSEANTLAANTPSAADTSAAAPSAATTTETRTTTHRTTTRRAPVVRSRSTTLAAAPERPVTSRSATSAGVNTGATAALPPAPATTQTSPQTSAGAVLSTPSTAPPPAAATAPPVSSAPTPAPTPSTTTPDVSPPPASATAPSTTTPPPQ
jgi:hypothetical protein